MLVQFTELDINTEDLKKSRVAHSPFPKGWSRVRIDDPNTMDMSSKLMDWCLRNLNGRFGYINSYPHYVVYFEDQSDAILFQMLDGAHACMEQK